MPNVVKQITRKELEFAKLVGEYDYQPVEAARKIFEWRCEPGSKEAQKARDLVRTPRVKMVIDEIRKIRQKRIEAVSLSEQSPLGDAKTLSQFLIKRLKAIRDDDGVNSNVRYQAIVALEKLKDPAADLNLILRWVNYAWSFMTAHCPACHHSFPLARIRNEKLAEYREKNGEVADTPVIEDLYDRRLQLIQKLDLRRRPHPSQITAIKAMERHIVATAAAQSGKSYLMAVFATMVFLVPGSETWILGGTFERAVSEVEYLKNFLKTLFYPYEDDLIDSYEDKKDGELVMLSRWGSILKVRSAKATGSITARPLDLALVAEPGWVPENIYNHLRARMTTKLGRIIALGTPQDTQGFLQRMIKVTGRDEAGKIIRRSADERLIANGCPWDESMLIYNIDPRDNPEYVQSELRAAQKEMTDREYATEFRGETSAGHGAKFPFIVDKMLREMPREFFQRAQFCLGIDQGPANFGACLVAWDGKMLVPCYEFFDQSNNTMKANLIRLETIVPKWIASLGGHPTSWVHTITDRDPPLSTTFEEMKREGNGWPTKLSERHENRYSTGENWRRENQEYFNNLCRTDRVVFHQSSLYEPLESSSFAGAALLYDQLKGALDRPENPAAESGGDRGRKKGWIIRDAWRGDHVCDAFYLALWTIYTGQIQIPEEKQTYHSPYDEAAKGLQYLIEMSDREERRDYNPYNAEAETDKIFSHVFGRERKRPTSVGMSNMGHYHDA